MNSDMNNVLKISVLSLVIFIASCNREPSDARALLQATPPTPDLSMLHHIVMSSQHHHMEIILLSAPSCEHAAGGVLRWTAPKGAHIVQIWVAGAGNEKVFTEGAGSGAADAGTWITPGIQFVMRAQGSNQFLDSLTIFGKPCD